MTAIEITAVSGSFPGDARPPIASRDPAPRPGTAVPPPPYPLLRPTVWPRRRVHPRPWYDAFTVLGYPVDHHYVRRFWTAVLGPGAVADLLRLAVAARRGRSLLLPLHTRCLLREGLVHRDGDVLWVRPTVPPLSAAQVLRLPAALRREHGRYRLETG